MSEHMVIVHYKTLYIHIYICRRVEGVKAGQVPTMSPHRASFPRKRRRGACKTLKNP